MASTPPFPRRRPGCPDSANGYNAGAARPLHEHLENVAPRWFLICEIADRGGLACAAPAISRLNRLARSSAGTVFIACRGTGDLYPRGIRQVDRKAKGASRLGGMVGLVGAMTAGEGHGTH